MASAGNSLPTIAAPASTARSPGPRRSRRAASKASIVGGSGMSPPSRPVSAAMASSCSRKRGLLSAADVIRARVAAGSATSPSRLSSSDSDSLGKSGSRKSDVASSARPRPSARPALEQVRPCKTNEEDGRAARPPREMLDEIEERPLGPVEVFEDDDERTLAGDFLHQLADGPERLLLARRPPFCEPEGRRDQLRDRRGLLVAAQTLENRLERSLARGLVNDLLKRPERDALSVGEAAPRQDLGVLSDEIRQLAGEPRLADSRGPQHCDKVGRAVPPRVGRMPRAAGRALRLCPPRECQTAWRTPARRASARGAATPRSRRSRDRAAPRASRRLRAGARSPRSRSRPERPARPGASPWRRRRRRAVRGRRAPRRRPRSRRSRPRFAARAGPATCSRARRPG